MTLRPSDRAWRISKVWAYGMLGLFGLLYMHNTAYRLLTGEEAWDMMNLDAEMNIPVLLSIIVYLGILIPVITLIVREITGHKRWFVLLGYALAVLAAVFISVDELLTVHEVFGAPIARRFILCPLYDGWCHVIFGRLWIYLYFPAGSLLGVVMVSALRAADKTIIRNKWIQYGFAAFFVVLFSELIEIYAEPYINYAQEVVEIGGALAFFLYFAERAWRTLR